MTIHDAWAQEVAASVSLCINLGLLDKMEVKERRLLGDPLIRWMMTKPEEANNPEGRRFIYRFYGVGL